MFPPVPSSIEGYRPAPFTPGTYRVGGTKSHDRYPTREIHDYQYSTFFVELTFADGGAFDACVSARHTSSHSRSRHSPQGEANDRDEKTFYRGFTGTWRRDGDLAVAKVGGMRHTCDSEARPSSELFTLTCSGLVATAGPHRLVQCALAGSWAKTLDELIAPWMDDDGTPWFLAGDHDGLEIRLSSRDQVTRDFVLRPANGPLSRPVP